MRVRTALFLPLCLGVTLMLAGSAGRAAAQCYVIGPSEMCSGGVELCAPPQGVEFQWTGPSGPLPGTACILATQPGTYTLRFFDGDNGLWFGPCSHTVEAGGGGAACSITGPTTGCTETGVELCGPEGMSEYTWTGPDGFTASTACVTAMASGTYSLVVRASAGCMSEPCSHTVSLAPCRIGGGDNCPWPPSAWTRQCKSRKPALSREQIGAIAKCVDDRSAVFAWGDDEGGRFCRTVANRCDLRARARRHFAAVLASVCATDLGIVARRNKPLGLHLSTPVEFADGRKTTVGEWVADAESRLLALENRSLRAGGVKDGYRALIREGWWIDHGRGMGEVCGVSPMVLANAASSGESAEDDDHIEPDFSLDEELADAENGVRIDRVSPNPSPGTVFVNFSVAVESGEDVSVAVYDIAGRQLRELARGRHEPGSYTVRWDGVADDGRPVPSGMYFVLGRVGAERTETRLMLVR
jgi:hypothetical protein